MRSGFAALSVFPRRRPNDPDAFEAGYEFTGEREPQLICTATSLPTAWSGQSPPGTDGLVGDVRTGHGAGGGASCCQPPASE